MITRKGRNMETLKYNRPEKKNVPKAYSDEWQKIANALARDFCPQIFPCRHCGYPVVTGYCCGNLECKDPSNPRG